MRFQVPQFIEVEDKIFGPLTWKQFLYLAGGGGIALATFTLLSDHKIIATIIAGPFIGLSLALAFVKINNRPFIIFLESIIHYASTKRLYIWKKEPKKITPGTETHSAPHVELPHLSQSKLKDMSWSLGVTKGNEGNSGTETE